jgi:muconate cycloisomerase
MKITSVEIIPINQPHKGKLIFSSGPYPAPDDFIIVRVRTDEGIEGIGSGCSFTPAPMLPSGCSRDSALYLMRDLATILIGKNPLQLSLILESLEKAISGFFTENWFVFSHFDAALYDLKGKILDLPVYELLGGVQREEIPLEWIQSFLPTPEEIAEESKRYIDAGFKAVKVHVNSKDPISAEARVKAVRRAIGDDVPLAIDMGMSYEAMDAAHLLKRLDSEYWINFAEQPLHPYDFNGMVRLRAHTTVPLTADQSGMSLREGFEYLKLNVFDSFHFNMTRVGGINRTVKFADMMETARLGYQICNQGGTIAGTVAAHVAVTRKDRRFLDELGLYLYVHGTTDTKSITDDIVKEQSAVIENGVLHVPKGPGLGLELDEEMMKRYAAPDIDPIIVK